MDPRPSRWVRAGLLGLPLYGLLTFWTTLHQGRAYLAGIEGLPDLPTTTATTAQGVIGLLVLVLGFVGNVLLGLAIWRSGVLPRWTAAAWTVAALLMYPFGLLVAATVTGSTPRTVLVGALLITASGGWIAWSVQRGSSRAQLPLLPQPSGP